MFRFALTKFLILYVLVPLIGVFLWYGFRLKRRALERFGSTALLAKLSRSVNRSGQIGKAVLLVAAVLFVVTALARPQFGTRVETVKGEGQDIIVALDVSKSMLAEDVAPNRLEKAKHAVSSMISKLDGDRIGLVAFAGEAFVQSPLTLDYGAAEMFLHAMEPDLIPVPGTDLGDALEKSLEAFGDEGGKHEVVILITDGEDHIGNIKRPLERAMDDGVIIYTVGIGSPEGVPIPDIDSLGVRHGFKKDEKGEVVLSRLDETTLREIAQKTGGRYFRATAGESELDTMVDEIAAMDKKELASRRFTKFEEQYQVFVGLAIVLLTAEFLVPERRRSTHEWRGRFQ
ncbi:MAG: VWA domain-containing protein [Gemmatimonadales bacterium]